MTEVPYVPMSQRVGTQTQANRMILIEAWSALNRLERKYTEVLLNEAPVSALRLELLCFKMHLQMIEPVLTEIEALLEEKK